MTKKRTTISLVPAECYLHEYVVCREHPALTASMVNCTLTADATRTRVALVATTLKPEERSIIPGSARIVDGEIVAEFATSGGNSRRIYTMEAAEARELAKSLSAAAEFVENGPAGEKREVTG